MGLRTAPTSKVRRLATMTADAARSRPLTVTATQTEHRGDVADGAAAAAAAAAPVTGKTAMSASGRRLTATAASRRGMAATGRPGLPIRMVTTRRCRLGMAGGPPPNRPATPAGRKHRAAREASLPALASRKTVSRAKQGGVAAGVAAAVKEAAAGIAAPQRRPRPAGSRVVQVMRVPAAVAVAAGAQATSAGRRRPSIAGDAMNSLRWQEAAKKTTRAWNSSVLRMSATTATAATTVIQRKMMTPSSRAASTRCSTCRAGWRRSASSSPEISMPAADHPAGETVAVVASSGPTLHHAAAHPTGRLATHAAAAAQAAINADGIRSIRMTQARSANEGTRPPMQARSASEGTRVPRPSGHPYSLACAAGLDEPA